VKYLAVNNYPARSATSAATMSYDDHSAPQKGIAAAVDAFPRGAVSHAAIMHALDGAGSVAPGRDSVCVAAYKRGWCSGTSRPPVHRRRRQLPQLGTSSEMQRIRSGLRQYIEATQPAVAELIRPDLSS